MVDGRRDGEDCCVCENTPGVFSHSERGNESVIVAHQRNAAPRAIQSPPASSQRLVGSIQEQAALTGVVPSRGGRLL